ncbi:enoyl-CoA hydratase/isomerase family protein [Rhodococcus rhodochrous]|uniref:enoyl-CoA hydratase/isomerase family protein n=1 Tax=Rhodococcus rhodochrous TaxID=1829 RepID=UPI0003665A5B|nr:enoyl-CoA hydratase-related protein [Rhodococcus rhodochrous]
MASGTNGVATADLKVAVTDHVATVEINRPPNNFFDLDLIRSLADAFDELGSGSEARVIVLRSAGRHFCAGAAHTPGSSGPGDPTELYAEAVRLFRAPLPVVAAIQGASVGGGLGLAMMADFRIAAPEARFTANFALLGFHHGFGLSVTLPRVVGPQAAQEMLYTGKRIDAEAALAIGLVDRVVPAAELERAAHDIATEIATAAPLAVRSIRRTLREQLANEVSAALRREAVEQVRLMGTDDFREGLAAVSERRPGQFSGR